MLAVKNAERALGNPIAQNHKTSRIVNCQVNVNMTMTKDEVTDLRMCFQICSGKSDQAIALRAIKKAFYLLMLLTTVSSPSQSEVHSPSGMDGSKEFLTNTIMENTTQQQIITVAAV